jgi:hypothetical protein
MALPQWKNEAQLQPAPQRSERTTFVDVMAMHVRRGAKHGALRTSDTASVVRVIANLMAGQAVLRHRLPDMEEVGAFARRYGLDIYDDQIAEIAEDEFGRGEWLTSEGVGQLLRLNAEDQERLGLWSIGVYGETAADQKARTAARQAARKAARDTEREKARGPFHVNITEASREFGLSRPTLYKLRDQWREEVVRGEYAGTFYSFVASSTSLNKKYIFCGKRWSVNDLVGRLGKSERTIRRWLKTPGKIELELGRRARSPRKPGSTKASLTVSTRGGAIFPAKAQRPRAASAPKAAPITGSLSGLGPVAPRQMVSLADSIAGSVDQVLRTARDALLLSGDRRRA